MYAQDNNSLPVWIFVTSLLTHISINSQPFLVGILSALYGTVKAAWVFWERLAKHLVADWGFTLNPYDQYVTNKMINGSQCSVVWHVDDLKISHVQEKEVNDIVHWLNKEFGSRDPMIHDYLGLTLDYTTPGMLKVDITSYVDGVLEEAHQDMTGTANTPVASYLFKVNLTDPIHQDMTGTANTPVASYLFKVNLTDPILLGPSKKEIFHHITMELAYLAQWGHPDICTAIAFLQT